MSKALIAFTALLGLFSFHSNSASNDGSTCRQKAELAETASPRFIGASTCSTTGSVFTGNDHCQVRANPSSTCQQDQFGVWVGLNYYFTGCLAGTECGNQPDPDPDPEDPDPEEPQPPQPPEPLNPVTPIEWQDPTIIGGEFGAVNSNIARLSDSFKTLSTSLNKTISDTANNQLLIAKRIDNLTATQNALKDDTTIANQKLTTLQRSQNYGHADIKDNDDYNFNALYNQAERHNGVTQQGISDIKQQSNQLLALEFQIEGVMGTVTTANNYVQETLPKMALANSDSFGQVIGGLAVIEQRLDSLNTGGGGGTDMTVTNNLLRETIGNIQGVQSSVNNVTMYTSRTASGIESLSWSLSDLYSNNLEQLWETQAFKTQTGEQLAAIKEALESGVGGGGSNEEVVERLDTSNYELSELRKLLDSRTQTANSSLSGIGSALQSLNDSATAQGQKLGQISGTLDGIDESLDGIGDSLNGLKDGLQGEGMTVGDFNPEGGVLDALGIDGDESVDDLTADPIKLEDYRSNFEPFLEASECPQNIPVKMRILGKDYTFNLYYQPVCDFMGIAGTILNWAVWLSVPFIVFGRRSAT